jgi:hypothetical protein
MFRWSLFVLFLLAIVLSVLLQTLKTLCHMNHFPTTWWFFICPFFLPFCIEKSNPVLHQEINGPYDVIIPNVNGDKVLHSRFIFISLYKCACIRLYVLSLMNSSEIVLIDCQFQNNIYFKNVSQMYFINLYIVIYPALVPL